MVWSSTRISFRLGSSCVSVKKNIYHPLSPPSSLPLSPHKFTYTHVTPRDTPSLLTLFFPSGHCDDVRPVRRSTTLTPLTCDTHATTAATAPPLPSPTPLVSPLRATVRRAALPFAPCRLTSAYGNPVSYLSSLSQRIAVPLPLPPPRLVSPPPRSPLPFPFLLLLLPLPPSLLLSLPLLPSPLPSPPLSPPSPPPPSPPSLPSLPLPPPSPSSSPPSLLPPPFPPLPSPPPPLLSRFGVIPKCMSGGL